MPLRWKETEWAEALKGENAWPPEIWKKAKLAQMMRCLVGQTGPFRLRGFDFILRALEATESFYSGLISYRRNLEMNPWSPLIPTLLLDNDLGHICSCALVTTQPNPAMGPQVSGIHQAFLGVFLITTKKEVPKGTLYLQKTKNQQHQWTRRGTAQILCTKRKMYYTKLSRKVYVIQIVIK